MMNINNLYLIDKDTYLEHINDKVRLCAMVRQLAAEAKKLPCSKAGNPLCELAAGFESKAAEIFDELCIPASYPVTFDEDELNDLLEADLMEPEEAGYILCDGDCDDDHPCCAACEQEDECKEDAEKTASNADSDKEKIEEMSQLIRDMMADIFGIDVRVKYVPGK